MNEMFTVRGSKPFQRGGGGPYRNESASVLFFKKKYILSIPLFKNRNNNNNNKASFLKATAPFDFRNEPLRPLFHPPPFGNETAQHLLLSPPPPARFSEPLIGRLLFKGAGRARFFCPPTTPPPHSSLGFASRPLQPPLFCGLSFRSPAESGGGEPRGEREAPSRSGRAGGMKRGAPPQTPRRRRRRRRQAKPQQLGRAAALPWKRAPTEAAEGHKGCRSGA